MSTMRDSFLLEAEELLAGLTRHLLALEVDPQIKLELEGASRLFHSLKALAGSVGVRLVALISHVSESILSKIKEGSLNYSQETGDMFFKGIDLIHSYLNLLGTETEHETETTPCLKDIIQNFQDFVTVEETVKFIMPGFPQNVMVSMSAADKEKLISYYDAGNIIGILSCKINNLQLISPNEMKNINEITVVNEMKHDEIELNCSIVAIVTDNENLFVLASGKEEPKGLNVNKWRWAPLTSVGEIYSQSKIIAQPKIIEGYIPPKKERGSRLKSESGNLISDEPWKSAFNKLQEELLSEMEERLDNVAQWVLKAEREKDKKEQEEALQEVYRLLHSLKGTSLLYGFSLAGYVASELEEIISFLQKNKQSLTSSQVDLILKGIDTLRRAFPNGKGPDGKRLTGKEDEKEIKLAIKNIVSGFKERTIPKVLQTPVSSIKSEEVIRIPRKRLDNLVAITGELLTSLEGFDRFSRSLDNLAQFVSKRRVSFDKEFLNDISSQASYLSFKFSMLLAKSSKLLSSLRQETLQARMIPIGHTLSTFPRAVRDIARQLGKEAILEMEGIQTELDRVMADALHDPLMHIIRNAVDHGIELPLEREKAGKPRCGIITIKARPQGSQIVIEISDDGRGLDLEKIKHRALELGLLSREDAYSFIFTAGFSTAEKVTEISGRGVGMDVVKNSIEEVKGNIELFSVKGEGVTFKITVPLTLAIIQGLFFSIGEEIMAVPSTFVTTVKKVELAEVRWLEGKSVMNLGRETIPVIDLGELMELESKWRPMAVIASFGGATAALMVDDILEVQDMVIKDLGALLSKLPLVTGSTMRHDGSLVIVLDVAALIKKGLTSNMQALDSNKISQTRQKRVLLVEDSLTTRQLFSRLLSLAGYRVLEARDGLEALDLIKLNIIKKEEIDIVVTDVQMPRMDGITLTKEIKSSYPYLPVIIITGLSKEEERKLGLLAGADSYIVKGEFKSPDLFQTIKRLTGEPV